MGPDTLENRLTPATRRDEESDCVECGERALIMGFQLVVVQGRSASQALKIGTGVMTVGRQQDCQLRIASSQVSRKHCQLFEKKGLLLVKDLGSANGTLVNGKKIADQRVLEHGDELSVGSVKFRIERTEDTVLMPGINQPSTVGAKPGDTAIAQPISGEDDLIELEDEDATGLPAAQKSDAKKASLPSGTSKSQAAQTEETIVEIDDDVVADYLLNIDLDDEDKV
jgi:pSer/pThr/pTyr-binding forkhead associated (FHA) protein